MWNKIVPLSLVFMTFFILSTAVQLVALDGCRQADAVAERVRQLNLIDWRTTTEDTLIQRWPELLVSNDCHSNIADQGCFYLLDIQRFINPSCQCCMMISFDRNQGKESLRKVLFTYSSETYEDIIHFLKVTLPNTGVVKEFEPDSKNFAYGKRFDHTWKVVAAGIPTIVIAEGEQEGGIWNLRLTLAHPENLEGL